MEPKVEDLRNSEYGMPCASSIKNETVNNEMECPKKLTAKRISTKKSTKLKGSIAQPESKLWSCFFIVISKCTHVIVIYLINNVSTYYN